MMSSSEVSRLSRRLEILSLIISALGWPLLFIGSGIFIFFITPQLHNPIVGYSASFLIIIVGLSWDTKYFVGGSAFVIPLSNYLNHINSKTDRNKAQFSFFSSVGVIFFIFCIIIYLLP